MRNVFICLLILVLALLSACSVMPSSNPSSSGSESMSSSSHPSSVSSGSSSTPPSIPEHNPDIPAEELEIAGKEFANRLVSFDIQNIRTVYIGLSPLIGGELKSDDKELVQEWMDLLGKMETEAVPYQLLGGMSFSLYFETDKGKERIGSFMSPHIYTASERTLIHIKNYAALENEFTQLKLKMGYDPSKL